MTTAITTIGSGIAQTQKPDPRAELVKTAAQAPLSTFNSRNSAISELFMECIKTRTLNQTTVCRWFDEAMGDQGVWESRLKPLLQNQAHLLSCAQANRALIIAGQMGWSECIAKLGARNDISAEWAQQAFTSAVNNRHFHCLESFLQIKAAGKEIAYDVGYALTTAVEQGHEETIELLRQKNIPIGLIHWAIKRAQARGDDASALALRVTLSEKQKKEEGPSLASLCAFLKGFTFGVKQPVDIELKTIQGS